MQYRFYLTADYSFILQYRTRLVLFDSCENLKVDLTFVHLTSLAMLGDVILVSNLMQQKLTIFSLFDS